MTSYLTRLVELVGGLAALERAFTMTEARPVLNRRRFHPLGTFTPTSGSWLALVDVGFPIIERQAIHRGSLPSVLDLVIKIRAFINGWNHRCHPFTSTKLAV